MLSKKLFSFKRFILLQSVFLTACTQMPQLNSADTFEYDSDESQGISIEELLSNARNNTVAPPQTYTPVTQIATGPKIKEAQTLSAKEKFDRALEREKMRDLLEKSRQRVVEESPTEPAPVAETQPLEERPLIQKITKIVSNTSEPETVESQSVTVPLKSISIRSTGDKEKESQNLYHIQRKAKEGELRSFLITLSFQTNSSNIDAILEDELDLFSRLHANEQLVINCAISKEKDTKLAYETALLRCLSIETFFNQRNHVTMSQVLRDIEPNQVLIYSDGLGF